MAVCESVLPTMPNLNGFTPNFRSSISPFLSASRAYSHWSISGFFASVPLRLDLSHFS